MRSSNSAGDFAHDWAREVIRIISPQYRGNVSYSVDEMRQVIRFRNVRTGERWSVTFDGAGRSSQQAMARDIANALGLGDKEYVDWADADAAPEFSFPDKVNSRPKEVTAVGDDFVAAFLHGLKRYFPEVAKEDTDTITGQLTAGGAMRLTPGSLADAVAGLVRMPPPLKSDDALKLIVEEIKHDPNPRQIAGEWMARFTNQVSDAVSETEEGSET